MGLVSGTMSDAINIELTIACSLAHHGDVGCVRNRCCRCMIVVCRGIFCIHSMSVRPSHWGRLQRTCISDMALATHLFRCSSSSPTRPTMPPLQTGHV